VPLDLTFIYLLKKNRYASRLDIGFEYHFNAILIFIVIISTITYFFELREILRKVISQELLNKKFETCDCMNPNVIRSCLFCILPFLFQWVSNNFIIDV